MELTKKQVEDLDKIINGLNDTNFDIVPFLLDGYNMYPEARSLKETQYRRYEDLLIQFRFCSLRSGWNPNDVLGGFKILDLADRGREMVHNKKSIVDYADELNLIVIDEGTTLPRFFEQMQEQHIESIIQKMKDSYGRLNFGTAVKNNVLRGDESYYVAITRRMEIKGLIYPEDKHNTAVYILTDYGWSFNGFEEERHERSTKRRLELEQMQSVINTNNSVQSNIKTQERVSFWSVTIAGLSILFIGISAYLQAKDKTAKEVEGLKTQVQKSSQSLDSIELYLKEIDSSTKRIFRDSSRFKNTMKKNK